MFPPWHPSALLLYHIYCHFSAFDTICSDGHRFSAPNGANKLKDYSLLAINTGLLKIHGVDLPEEK